mmetsp:Transcript_37205/g.86787  ORF Transcript_37205/g.86787 Transcript_37205/m.86787 type:complete len:151 (-) Transcript_37205:1620-2072(-)
MKYGWKKDRLTGGAAGGTLWAECHLPTTTTTQIRQYVVPALPPRGDHPAARAREKVAAVDFLKIELILNEGPSIDAVYISSDLFDLFIHREVNERQLQCSSAGQSDLIYFSPKLIQPHALHHCPILFARSTREGATIAARSCPNTRWWKP